MLITGRQARAALLHAGVPDRRARVALTCGLAGPAVETSAALLYDADRVEALGRRRVVSHEELHERCTGEVFVSRRPVQVTSSPDRLRAQLSAIPGQFSVLTMHGRDLVLEEPGEWFEGLEDCQLLTGKGRQWKLLAPPRPPLQRARYVSPTRPPEEWDPEIDVDDDLDPDADW